jgi:hypothetical protein
MIPIHNGLMKTIFLHVHEDTYSDFRSLADRRGQPVAELIREAMAEYLAHEPEREISLFDLDPHASGPLLEPWARCFKHAAKS